MRVCFIGKYPPIEGGVSRENFWMAQALAQAGFEVFVVTNAPEVETEFRLFESGEESLLSPSHRRVRVYTTSGDVSYIPQANPFVTKLASLATEVIHAHQCELIFGYYLEPYGVAAFLASQWTGVPYLLRHAGSDIGRLFLHADLQQGYREILFRAGGILTSRAAFHRFLSLGIDLDRLYLTLPSCLHEEYFTPSAPPMDVDAFLAHFRNSARVQDYLPAYARLALKPFDPTLPTVGVYGKIGRNKGHFDLLRALGRLRVEGACFNLLVLTQGRSHVLADFLEELTRQDLEAATWLLPFVPHWQIPSFIRRCTAVCFLERQFGIAIHNSAIPREVLACGTCLVVSHEMVDKQVFRAQCRHGENVYLVDPLDHQDLVGTLRAVVSQPELCMRIGEQGHQDLMFNTRPFPTYAQELASLFTEIAQDCHDRRMSMSLAEMQAALARMCSDGALRHTVASNPETLKTHYQLTDREYTSLVALPQKELEVFAGVLAEKRIRKLIRAYPFTAQMLPEALLLSYARRYCQLNFANAAGASLEALLDFGAFLEASLAAEATYPPYWKDIVLYERLYCAAAYRPLDESFQNVNVMSAPPAEIGSLAPDSQLRLRKGCYLGHFHYDVPSLVQSPPPDPSEVQPQTTFLVLMHRRADPSADVFAVSEDVAALLEMCEQPLPLEGLMEALVRRGIQAGSNEVCAAVHRLREQEILEVVYA